MKKLLILSLLAFLSLGLSAQMLNQDSFAYEGLMEIEYLPLGLATIEFQGQSHRNYITLPPPISHELQSTPESMEYYRRYRNKRLGSNILFTTGVVSVTALAYYWLGEMADSDSLLEGTLDFMGYFFTASLAGGICFGGGAILVGSSRKDLYQSVHHYNRHQLEHWND